MKYAPYLLCLYFVVAALLGSCGGNKNDEQLRMSLDSFACHYFNWQFREAIPYVTPSSERWLRYAASQVRETEVEKLRNMDRPAEFEVDKIEYHDGDSTAWATLTVRHLLLMDSIGTDAHLADEAVYNVELVKAGGKWLVRMANLPRSGTKSRD